MKHSIFLNRDLTSFSEYLNLYLIFFSGTRSLFRRAQEGGKRDSFLATIPRQILVLRLEGRMMLELKEYLV